MKPWLRSVLAVLAAVLIFVVGWGVGSGRISLTGLGGSQSQNKELPATLDYASVTEVYRQLKNNFDGKLDEAALIDGLKTGLVRAAGDPHTAYLNQEQYQNFDDDLNNSFSGIGAELSEDEEGNIEIVAPIPGYPAEEAGLRAGDIIIRVDDTSTSGMTVTEAVGKIRGLKGTNVKLTVVRANQQLEFDITRDTISLPSVEAEVKDGIGYLQISRFNSDTAGLAQKAAEDFKQQKVTGVVVDLRNNIGGTIGAAVDVAGMWLPRGTTVLTERRGDKITSTLRSQGDPILQGVPTVVLTNAGSASASEIVAGALRDHDAATLVGDTTYGKGSVQKLIHLRGGGVLKVTVARWFTPSGHNIDEEGITPDQEVTITEEDYENNHDSQEAAALEALR